MPLPSLGLLDRVIVDSRRGTPMHLQLRNGLRQIIIENFEHGDLFWPETTLAEYLKISRGTTRRALGDLAREGLLTRHHARGSFVQKAQPGTGIISCIYVFVTSYTSDYTNKILDGLSAACRDSDREMFVCRLDSRVEVDEARSMSIAAAGNTGIILVLKNDVVTGVYTELKRRGYRTVALDFPPPSTMAHPVDELVVGALNLLDSGEAIQR